MMSRPGESGRLETRGIAGRIAPDALLEKDSKMKYLTCLVLVASMALLGACGKEKAPACDKPCDDDKKHSGSICPTYDAAEVKVGEKSCCPVSKDNFTVAANSLFFSTNGKKFYVCDEDCRVALAKNPDQYLKAGAGTDGGKAHGASEKGHEGHKH